MAPIVLITGANAGLGYETVKALCQSSVSYKIYLAGRNLEKAEAAVKKVQSEVPETSSTISAVQLDLECDKSIEAAFEHVSSKVGALDVLVNNAGASFDVDIQEGKMSVREGWNASWNVNVAGTHIVTSTFIPLLIKSSTPRLIFVTSGTASLEETKLEHLPVNKSPPAGWPKPETRSIMSYRSTKVGLNMMMKEWARILKNDGVKVFAVAPGFLATGLGGEDLKALGAVHPSVGGASLRKVIEGERDEDAGKAIRNYSTPVQPW